jgi:hypothetical protein
MKKPGEVILAVSAVVLVVIAVISGLRLHGPPAEEHLRRLDSRRVSDLRAIARAVDLHWTRIGSLPSSLEDLPPELRTTLSLSDPETRQPYEYRVLGSESYELCARFARGSPMIRESNRDDFWLHGAGRHCFEISVKRIDREPRGRIGDLMGPDG